MPAKAWTLVEFAKEMKSLQLSFFVRTDLLSVLEALLLQDSVI